MKKIIILCFISLVITLIGCEREERVPRIVIGHGALVTETISVSSFHSVILVGMENLTINSGDLQTLKISAQENVIDVISHEVKSGVLTIDFLSKVTVSTVEPISIEITHPDLSRVSLEGIGNFDLYGEHSKDIELEFAGTGNMDASNLYLSICDFILSGSGNCEIRADSILNVTLSGIGNVTYYGDPEITINITGAGNVIDGG
jgi:hypothetical protein